MRVIAGSAGGRRLRSPKGTNTRPTSDLLKESMFASLGPQVSGMRVLDLYAGSGALGIEALSRGAVHATFVEADRETTKVLRANLSALDFTDRATIVAAPVDRVAGRLPAPVDLVLADPPYSEGPTGVYQVLELLYNRGLMSAGVWIVIEQSRRDTGSSPDPPPFLVLDRQRTYGDTTLSYLQINAGA